MRVGLVYSPNQIGFNDENIEFDYFQTLKIH